MIEEPSLLRVSTPIHRQFPSKRAEYLLPFVAVREISSISSIRPESLVALDVVWETSTAMSVMGSDCPWLKWKSILEVDPLQFFQNKNGPHKEGCIKKYGTTWLMPVAEPVPLRMKSHPNPAVNLSILAIWFISIYLHSFIFNWTKTTGNGIL